MAGPNSWMIFAALGFFHIIGNALLTRDVFSNYPFLKERVLLNVLIWAIPVAGAFYVFRKIGLDHYKTSEPSNTGVAVGLLGMNEIFNPNAKPRYAIEQQIKERDVGEEMRDWIAPTALKTEFSFALPDWLSQRVPANLALFSVETRMQFVLGIAREQVRRGSGGPFAAAVFGPDGQLLSVGVNLVEPTQCSLLHAEMVAIALAQKALGRYDLGAGGTFDCELVTSTEPCAMCFGAVPWSGVTRLVCAARDADARAIGFDEGAKLPDWQLALEQRGITVTRDLMRADAVAILQDYASKGGLIYNG